MKLYEKTGDHKVTGLKDGTCVSKQDVRVHLMGELDELNSHIGLVRSLTQNKALWQELLEIQKILLAIKHGVEEPEGSRVKSVAGTQVKDLEIKIGCLERQLPQTEGEILPGGCFYSAQFDIARNVARRCERRFAEVAACYPMDELALVVIRGILGLLILCLLVVMVVELVHGTVATACRYELGAVQLSSSTPRGDADKAAVSVGESIAFARRDDDGLSRCLLYRYRRCR